MVKRSGPGKHIVRERSISTVLNVCVLFYFDREQPIFTCKAHVFHIDPKTKRSWIPASSSAINVSFFFDSTRSLYRIISVEGTKVSDILPFIHSPFCPCLSLIPSSHVLYVRLVQQSVSVYSMCVLCQQVGTRIGFTRAGVGGSGEGIDRHSSRSSVAITHRRVQGNCAFLVELRRNEILERK